MSIKQNISIKHNRIFTLPSPKRPSSIPVSSHWLAGEGAGSWFSLVLLNNNNYFITRYSGVGLLECESEFQGKSNTSFDESKSFMLTYPSHCAIVTIVQDQKVFVLERVLKPF